MSSNDRAAEAETTLDWLLEVDDPAMRAVALRDLLDAPPDDPDYAAACVQRLAQGPVAEVLEAMDPAGFWISPDRPYSPKYKSTFWAMILLAQLGMRASDDPRIATACNHLLDTTIMPYGQVSYNGTPSGTIDCLQGNICRVLVEMGVVDSRLDRAIDWMARTVTGDGIAPAGTHGDPMRYDGYNCGPGFACRANYGAPCAWGATKVMLALAATLPTQRSPQVAAAIKQGVEFLLSVEPVTAAWPTGDGSVPDGRWWKFGFPVYYTVDLLQTAETLVALGYGDDRRLAATLDLIRAKRNAQGRWLLEYSYGSKSWGKFGRVGNPSKWVTLRALRVLKRTSGGQ